MGKRRHTRERAAPTYYYTSDRIAGLVGETTRVDARVSGLDAESVGAYDLAILWDGSLLAGSDLEFDVFLDGPLDSLQSAGSFGTGSVGAFEVSLSTLGNQTGVGGFRLFSFDLTALACLALWAGSQRRSVVR